jgi:hypothetical protein
VRDVSGSERVDPRTSHMRHQRLERSLHPRYHDSSASHRTNTTCVKTAAMHHQSNSHTLRRNDQQSRVADSRLGPEREPSAE